MRLLHRPIHLATSSPHQNSKSRRRREAAADGRLSRAAALWRRRSMRHVCCAPPCWHYMVCSRAIVTAGCVRRSVRCPELEDAVLDDVEHIIATCLWPRTKGPATATRNRRISYRIATFDTERTNFLRTVACVHSNLTRPLRAVQEIDAGLQSLKEELSDLRPSEPHRPAMHPGVVLHDRRSRTDQVNQPAAGRVSMLRRTGISGRTMMPSRWRSSAQGDN